jgi:nicotinate-nucleotide adenylyltransferase
MRAGLFGGTFNPIHKGHLMVARQVLQRLSLDRLYIIPCRVPPHKMPVYLAPTAHRIRMIELALPADSRYCLSEVEIQRDGPSYTIDTVNHFATRIIPGAVLHLIMGLDAFLEIHTWKSQRRLLKAARPVVVTRHVDGQSPDGDDIGRMDAYIRSRLSDDYQFDQASTNWQDTAGSRIHLLTTTPLDISSSEVRRRLREGKAVGDLVPAAVDAYIEKEELYR